AQQVPHEPHLTAACFDLCVVLPDAFEGKERRCLSQRDPRAHTKSSKCGDSRRNTHRPAKKMASATATATASPHSSARLPASNAARRRHTSQLNRWTATHGRIDSGTSFSG